MLKRVCTAGFTLVFGLSYTLAATPVPLGQVVANTVQVDGIAVPSGTTVLDQTLVRTTEDPAFIHLGTGEVVQLHRNSSVYLERLPSGEVQVMVRAGTMSYRSASGRVVTLPPSDEAVFPQRQTGREVSSVRVVLTQPAETGQIAITVNDATQTDPLQAVLLESEDGSVQEIHYVESYREHTIKLSAPLQNSFPVNTRVIQDWQLVRAAMDRGAPVVGLAAGVSVGAAAAGTAVGAGVLAATAAGIGVGGLSGLAIAGIVVGAGAGTYGTLEATGVINTVGDPDSPAAETGP